MGVNRQISRPGTLSFPRSREDFSLRKQKLGLPLGDLRVSPAALGPSRFGTVSLLYYKPSRHRPFAVELFVVCLVVSRTPSERHSPGRYASPRPNSQRLSRWTASRIGVSSEPRERD
jgi:hypothetical protein